MLIRHRFIAFVLSIAGVRYQSTSFIVKQNIVLVEATISVSWNCYSYSIAHAREAYFICEIRQSDSGVDGYSSLLGCYFIPVGKSYISMEYNTFILHD